MRVEIKWIAIILLVHVIWHVLERVFGFYGALFRFEGYASWAFLLVYTVLMFLALRDLRASNRGFLNRRHGFVSSLFISFILTALAPVIVALLAYLIQPDFFMLMINNALDSGEYRAYEAAAIDYSYWSYVKLYMAGYLLVGSLSGAFWSYLLHRIPEPATE